MEKPAYVHDAWDEEVRVWIASSEDVFGLASEADTVAALVEKFQTLIPELQTFNGRADATPATLRFLHGDSDSPRNVKLNAGSEAAAAWYKLSFRGCRQGRS